MSAMTKPLYMAVGALCLLVILAPLVVQVVAVLVPLLVVCGLVIVVVRLVWFTPTATRYERLSDRCCEMHKFIDTSTR
jgi:hypothetical protein